MMLLRFLALVLLLSVASAASAATRNVDLTNTFATNHIMLWVDDPASADITNVTFLSASMAGWVATIAADGNSATLSGATIAASNPITAGGEYRVRFTFPAPPSFSFQWAELSFDGSENTLLDSGSISYAAGAGYSTSNVFTHIADIPNLAAPVPLGNSTIFLISGAALLGFLRRPNPRD